MSRNLKSGHRLYLFWKKTGIFESWFCFCSNFFVFQSYELRFSGKKCLVLIRSFPESFVFGSSLEGIPTTIATALLIIRTPPLRHQNDLKHGSQIEQTLAFRSHRTHDPQLPSASADQQPWGAAVLRPLGVFNKICSTCLCAFMCYCCHVFNVVCCFQLLCI